jgi:SpoVK/Ycf46/Vps4 family AAA+-type ATPase
MPQQERSHILPAIYDSPAAGALCAGNRPSIQENQIMATSNQQSWATALDELVCQSAIPNRVHRILLYGPPGTGKSSWAMSAFSHVERVTLHAQMPPEDLIGSMALVARKGGTDTVWQDGPAVRAMRRGSALVLDEIDQHSPELRCALHAILDDRSIAGITLPTGERIEPAEGFCVIATTNAEPASLPEALLDRFDLVLLANRPASAIFDTLPRGLASVLARAYDRQSVARWTPAVSVRSILALTRLAAATGMERAAELIFGDSGVDILASAASSEE